MFVTVIICSRDRAGTLRRTLASLFSDTNLATPDWECLAVVDAGSRDGADEACRAFEDKFPERFRVLVQKASGKSNALNLGIAAARGDVLAMTDDDVICAPNYLEGIRTVFADQNVDGAQGRVLLDCNGGLPEWMSARQKRFMSQFDHGDHVQPWDDTLSGTNMAVRAEAARRVGGFAPELGPGGSGFGEDTEFSLRLLEAGCKLIYAPQIIVRHQLPRERLSKSFFRKRYFGLGRSEAYYLPLERYMPPEVPLWRFTAYAAKNLVMREGEAFYHRRRRRLAPALEGQCEARRLFGFVVQHWAFRRGLPRQLSRADFAALQGSKIVVEQTPGVPIAHAKDSLRAS